MLWKDKSKCWVKLKDLKASNPIELAEYAMANQIVEGPAFKWWVPNTLHKQNHISEEEILVDDAQVQRQVTTLG